MGSVATVTYPRFNTAAGTSDRRSFGEDCGPEVPLDTWSLVATAEDAAGAAAEAELLAAADDAEPLATDDDEELLPAADEAELVPAAGGELLHAASTTMPIMYNAIFLRLHFIWLAP